MKAESQSCAIKQLGSAEWIMWGLRMMAELMDGLDRWKPWGFCCSNAALLLQYYQKNGQENYKNIPFRKMHQVGYCLFKSNVYKMLPSSYIDMTIFSNLFYWSFFINTTLRLGSLWGAKIGLTAGTLTFLNIRGELLFASWESSEVFFSSCRDSLQNVRLWRT